MNNKNRTKSIANPTATMLSALSILRREVGGELTVNQLLVLLHVVCDWVSDGACSQSDICRIEKLNKTTVFNAVFRLKELDLIIKQEDPDDRRVGFLLPSDKCLDVRKRGWQELLDVNQ